MVSHLCNQDQMCLLLHFLSPIALDQSHPQWKYSLHYKLSVRWVPSNRCDFYFGSSVSSCDFPRAKWSKRHKQASADTGLVIAYSLVHGLRVTLNSCTEKTILLKHWSWMPWTVSKMLLTILRLCQTVSRLSQSGWHLKIGQPSHFRILKMSKDHLKIDPNRENTHIVRVRIRQAEVRERIRV